MTRRMLKRIIALTVIMCMMITSLPAMGYASIRTIDVEPVAEGTNNGPAPNAQILIEGEEEPKSFSEVTEDDIILEESNESMTTYDLGGGRKVTAFYSYDVRYLDENGNYVDIDPEFTEIKGKSRSGQGEQLTGYKYENKQGKNKTYIPEELSESTPVIMERDSYSITMTPTGYLNSILAKSNGKNKLKDDIVRTADNKNKNKKVKTVFGNESSEAFLEFVSTNEGLKENIVLNEIPKKNEFTFKLKLKGLSYRMNEGNGGITFYDETTGKDIAFIEPPFMNDATGEAYSEDLYYTMKRNGNSDNYTLTLTVDEKYLNAAERVYPVTIDPTVYWNTSSSFLEAYVNSGSPNKTYYGTSYQVMPSGRASSGNKYRTYIQFPNLRSQILGKDIISAALELYENGDGGSGYSVRVFDIDTSWSPSTLTWNTVPTYSTPSLDDFTSSGTDGSFKYFDVTSWAQTIADGGDDEYGLVIRNYTESSTSYVEFYGSRSSSTAYRPVFLVDYSADKPSMPSVYIANDIVTIGGIETVSGSSPVYVSWEDLVAYNVQEVQYRIETRDDDWNVVNSSFVPYTTLATAPSASVSLGASGTALIPGSANFPDGNYAIYLRGVGSGGGVSTAYGIKFIIDRTAPTAEVADVEDNDYYATAYWSVTEADFMGVDIYVNGVLQGTYLDEEGQIIISYDNLTEGQTYSVYIDVFDKAQNVTRYTKYFTVPIDDPYAPIVGNLSLIHSDNTTINESTWYNKTSGTFTLNYSGVTDIGEAGVYTGSLTCNVYAKEPTGTPIYTTSTTSPSYSSGAYSGSFSIPTSTFNESGLYFIEVEVYDYEGNGNYASFIYRHDKDAPTGSISIKDPFTEIPTDTLEGVMGIAASPSDDDSGVKRADLTIRNVSTQEVSDVKTNITLGQDVEFNSTTYANGEYDLILTVTDNVGLSTTVTKRVTIDNRLAAPRAFSDKTNTNIATIRWEYSQALDKLSMIQYSTDNGTSWTDVAIGDSKLSGLFTVTLPGTESGTYPVLVRGAEVSGETVIGGKERTVNCIIDKTAPTVSITSLENGILNGTITDSNLAEWQIFVKVKDADDSSYTAIAQGEDAVNNGRIGIVDLSASSYLIDTWYTVKVSATDTLGNTGYTTYDILKDAAYSSAGLVEPTIRIQRGYNQSYNSNTLLIGTETASIALNDIPTGTVQWFVNNALVSTDTTYTDTFATKYVQDIANRITAVIAGVDGTKSYTSNLITGAADYVIDWTAAVPVEGENSKEYTLAFEQDVLAFTFEAPSESSTGNAVTYMVKTGAGDYQSVIPGAKIELGTLAAGTLTANSLTIKATVAAETEWETLTAATVITDILDEEYFKMSSVEDFVPKNMSAEEGLNYKTYIKWQVDSTQELPADVYYQIYRGTEAGFTPDLTTLAGDNIKSKYWSEINVNYQDSFYYKVRAVKKNAEGEVIAASTFSNEMQGTVVSYDEYVKRLGSKEYWAYADLDMPSGTARVEKSEGNLVFSQVDGLITNHLLNVEFNRTYNSKATSKTAFGYGWTHSYDLELLSLYETDELEKGKIIFKDATGTLYFFAKGDDGKYISSLGKYITLEKIDTKETVTLPAAAGNISVEVNSAYTLKTKAKEELRFNSGGQLVYVKDGNGNFILMEYDDVYGVLNKITTGQNASITFTYDITSTGDPLLVSEATFPDGQKVKYTYNSDGRLIAATDMGTSADTTDDIVYEYSYTGDKITTLNDGNGNSYNIAYDEYNRVVSVDYPATTDSDGITYVEGVQFVYDASVNNTITTSYKTLKSGDAVAVQISSETDYFDSTFGNRIKHIDAEGFSSEYAYKDNLLEESKFDVEAGEIVDGVIQSVTTQKSEKTEYNSNEDIEKLKNTEGTYTEYVFLTETGKTHLPSKMTEKDAAGNIISEETYQYDSHENIIKLTDTVNKYMVETTYNYVGTAKGEIATEKEYIIDGYSNRLQRDMTCTYTFDAQGNKVKTQTEKIYAANSVETYRVTTVTTYDPSGRILTEVYTYQESDGSKSKKTVTNSYDVFGRVVATTTTECELTAAGTEDESTKITFTSAYEYDANDNLTLQQDNDGTIHTYEYDESNNLIKETLTKGNQAKVWTIEYTYEDVTVHTGIGATRSYTNAYVTTEILQEGTETYVLSKKYQDNLGRIIREVAQGVQVDYQYNAQGQVTSQYKVGLGTSGTEASSTVTHTIYIFDANGNQTGLVENPVYNAETGKFTVGSDTIVNTYTYDNRGNMLSHTDGVGNTTKYEYNANDEIIAVILPNSQKTTYAHDVYDSADNTTKTVTTYANAGVTETKYNVTGEITSITDKGDPTKGLTPVVKTYEYDAKDNLIKETYSKGNYKTYEYDARERLTAVNYYETETGSISERTEYTYKVGTDLKESMSDYKYVNGTKTLYRYSKYTYDQFNRLAGQAEVNTSGSMPSDTEVNAAMITYEYDINDNIVKVNYPDTGGETIGSLIYVYDANQRLTRVERTVSGTTTTLKSYSYLADGKLSTATEGNITEAYTYDQFDRPISKTYSVNGTEKEKHTYVYDKNNRVVTETQVNNWPVSSSAVVNESITYEYDLASQLIKSVKTNLNDNSVETTEYGYDAVGNRTAEKIGNILTQYDYDTLNRLNKTTESVSGVKGTEVNYDYDANGSLIEVAEGATVTTYAYDASNQMKQVTKTENGIVKMTQLNEYNGEGQRIRKTEGSEVTNYFYEGSSLLYTTDSSDALKGFIIYDGNGNLLIQIQSDGKYTYTTDIQGSIVNLVDSSANSVVSYTYSDFGVTAEKHGSDVYNELRYTGGVYDEKTGLYYLNARFYNPEIGRFLNPDSYRGEPVDPQSLHLYAYCANDPINHVDPTGHVVGTVLDVISVADSTRTFVRDPSLLNGVILAYDVVATVIPGVPASGVVKAATKTAKTAMKAADAVKDTAKVAKKATKATKKVVKATVKTSKTTKSVTSKLAQSTKKNIAVNSKSIIDNSSNKSIYGITGYTEHGLAQAIGRDGGLGVSPSAILDTVKNPIKKITQVDSKGEKTKYVGKQAVVVLNKEGKVITTFAKGSKYTRGRKR